MTRATLELDFSLPGPRGARRRASADPLRILILGSLGGAAGQPLAQRRPIAIDVDNFDRVFERLAPRIELKLDDSPVTFEPRSLDDFHPDRLYERLPTFVALRQLRAELADPAQFRRAAAALGRAPDAAATAGNASAREDSASDIERLLGPRPASLAASDPVGGLDIGAWLGALVAPDIVPDIGLEQQRALAAVDTAIAERMRRVLHDPAFQSLESLWRGVDRLVRTLELGESVQLFLLDISREELEQDLGTHGDDLSRSALHAHLCGPLTQPPDGRPWSLLATDLSFGAGLDDLRLLAALGALAGRAGAPLLAGANPSLLGCGRVADLTDPGLWQPLDSDTAAFWSALRQSPLAHWICLALPRLLARLPYGQGSDPVSDFAFEEQTVRGHETYLWGSPALALALLAGQSFAQDGWDLDLGVGLDLEDLPSHVYREDGESRQQPCAEIALGETAGQAALRQGLIPLMSYRNRNAVRVPQIQSIADPPRPLLQERV